ncbi:MAG TPA: cytochrome c oxidase assembly protein [Magnetospirillaceae bacterium]|jgi:putative membrane protein
MSVVPPSISRLPDRAWGWTALLVLTASILYWINLRHPAVFPVWAPWDFSWPIFASVVLAVVWYRRGWMRLSAAQRPRPWRSVSFGIGIAAMYAVSQTHIDFYAQHLFFVHRAQHIILHHLGPLLIALGAADTTIWAGMPSFLRKELDRAIVRRLLAVVQNPVIAPILFVGLIYFWLIPAVHFRAMLDARVYAVMNWSMALDGLLFWAMILDPRPKPPARNHFLTRALLLIVIAPPQILLGAILTFSSRDFFPVYAICGRLLPMSAVEDQHLGGLILWIPGAMMSLPALIAVLAAMRLSDDRKTITRRSGHDEL